MTPSVIDSASRCVRFLYPSQYSCRHTCSLLNWSKFSGNLVILCGLCSSPSLSKPASMPVSLRKHWNDPVCSWVNRQRPLSPEQHFGLTKPYSIQFGFIYFKNGFKYFCSFSSCWDWLHYWASMFRWGSTGKWKTPPFCLFVGEVSFSILKIQKIFIEKIPYAGHCAKHSKWYRNA